MIVVDLQHKETRLTETLFSALDARETARDTGSTLLLYVAELFVTRIREELADVSLALQSARRSAAHDQT